MDRPIAQGRDYSRRVLTRCPGLDLLLGGVMTGLLALTGAALIEASRPFDVESSPRCIAYQVGSPRAASTHVHVHNDGPERIYVRLDFVDHNGQAAQPLGYNPILQPSESGEFVFTTPALGAAVKLISSGRGLRAGVQIHYEDSTSPEIRRAIGCHDHGDALGLRVAPAEPASAVPASS
jgi:hypothetical protein